MLCIVGYRCAGHFEIIAAQKEQHGIARKADDIRDEYKLNGALRFQLESLEHATAKEDADAGAGHSNGTGKNIRLTLAQTKLCFQIFGKEHNESRDNHQFHAGTQTGYNIDRILDEA